MNKTARITLTVILSIIEYILIYCFNTFDFLISIFDSILLLMGIEGSFSSLFSNITSYFAPAPIIYLLNYYIFSTLIYKLALLVWHITGHYNYLKKRYKKVIESCINWLIDIDIHWGVNAKSTEPQNANTCEVLIALRESGLFKNKSEIYRNALNKLLENVTPDGLPSKSLNRSTVVCTSMMLYLVSLEKNDGFSRIENYEKYNNIASLLWDIRNENLGWGVYMKKTDIQYCSFANTSWALQSLNMYDVSQTQEYMNFLKMIFQRSHNGKFSFSPNEGANLVTTAKYLMLFYSLDQQKQNIIKEVYDYKSAIKFVYDQFVKQNIQKETETLYGININQTGAKKVPWNHISAGYAIAALVLAYKNKDLNFIKANGLFKHINGMLKDNITYTNENKCYYTPAGMPYRDNVAYTFPTAYLIYGLSRFID